MNKQIIAKVKFSKDGRIYNFLVKENVKIAKLKKGGTVIVDTRISNKKDIHRRKKAVLQDCGSLCAVDCRSHSSDSRAL